MHTPTLSRVAVFVAALFASGITVGEPLPKDPFPTRTSGRALRGNPPGPSRVEPREGERIAWFPTLSTARAEAARTGRPILLVAARPSCRSVPGVW